MDDSGKEFGEKVACKVRVKRSHDDSESALLVSMMDNTNANINVREAGLGHSVYDKGDLPPQDDVSAFDSSMVSRKSILDQ